MAGIRSVLGRMAQNDFFWFFFKPFVKAGSFILTEHNKKKDGEELLREKNYCDTLVKEIFSDSIVLHGPFKGLKYPSLTAAGSSVYPKLLGSYEKELHGLIEVICSTPYRQIVNIGCAEGYYAVGMALRISSANIIAFDLDPKARSLCLQLATLNNVANRIEINSLCTSDFLAAFGFFDRALVICDCEGFEKNLFTETSVRNLRTCDLLVETHDFIDIGISTYLAKLFSSTHNLQVFKSIDDIEKAKTYEFSELKDFNLSDRKKILREGRPAIMEWFWLTPKSDNN